MRILQFPWRFLEIATFGACALAGFATLHLMQAYSSRTFARFIPAAIIALLIIDFYPYGGSHMWRSAYSGTGELASRIRNAPMPFRVDHMSFPPADTAIALSAFRRVYPEYFTSAARDEFLRVKDKEKEREQLERAAVGVSFRKGAGGERLNPAPYAEFRPTGGAAQELAFTRGGERIEVTLPAQAGTLTLKEMWFPGWDATLNGRPVTIDQTEDGLMTLEVTPADSGELRLVFSRTRWDRLGGALLSLVCLAGLWWPRRSRRAG